MFALFSFVSALSRMYSMSPNSPNKIQLRENLQSAYNKTKKFAAFIGSKLLYFVAVVCAIKCFPPRQPFPPPASSTQPNPSTSPMVLLHQKKNEKLEAALNKLGNIDNNNNGGESLELEELPCDQTDPLWNMVQSTYKLSLGELIAVKNARMTGKKEGV
jgi:hypothetical protein